jgi:hypothetical protein
MREPARRRTGATRVALLSPLALLLWSALAVAQPQAAVTLCHRPPDNPGNYRTLTLGANAVAAHLAHGDLLGACLENCPALCGASPDVCTVLTATPNYLTGRCECTAGPTNCDDGEVCTSDTCAIPGGCAHTGVIGCVVGTQVADILRDPTRVNESPMGNLVADALRARYAGIDAALTNSGGLRADLRCAPPAEGESACEITWNELFAVLPFGNRNVLMTLTGAQLEAAMLNGFAPRCDSTIPTGRFPQVSGLVVEFQCAGTTPVVLAMWKAPLGPSGPKTLIGPADAVRLVTNDFMAFGGDGYMVLTAGADQVFTGDSMLNVVAAYIRAQSPVAPIIEGRIVMVP